MTLTPREVEVLMFMAKGKSYKQISKDMSLTVSTIKFYVRRAKNKLGATNSAHVVALFIQSLFISGRQSVSSSRSVFPL